MANGSLILICGPAAAGKSTIAKALHAHLGRHGDLWLSVQLDSFAGSLSRDWVQWGDHVGRLAGEGFAYHRRGDGRIDLEIGAQGRRVLAAFHRSVAAMVSSGVNVVCETIVHDAQDWADWEAALANLPACWVRISAPLAVLEARERNGRGPASQGLARGMSARPQVGWMALEADTSAETAEQIAQRIAVSSGWG